jgi:hypothetical protein
MYFHMNDLTGRIYNLGPDPVICFMFVGDAQSLQANLMDEAVLSGVIMPGASKDASELLTKKGLDLLTVDLVDSFRGEDVRAVLVFMSASPVQGFFKGMEYNVTISYQ